MISEPQLIFIVSNLPSCIFLRRCFTAHAKIKDSDFMSGLQLCILSVIVGNGRVLEYLYYTPGFIFLTAFLRYLYFWFLILAKSAHYSKALKKTKNFRAHFRISTFSLLLKFPEQGDWKGMGDTKMAKKQLKNSKTQARFSTWLFIQNPSQKSVS